MPIITPGRDSDPVPEGTLIFRIGEGAKHSPEAIRQGRVSPAAFELNSKDKASPAQRLSLWVEELTLADQAWDFLGMKPKDNVVACLNVDDIRKIQPPEGLHPLRVEWEPAVMDDGFGNDVPNTRPGAEGHVGIAGLNQGGKAQRRALRSDLADISRLSQVPVPHNIDEEHIRVAAYFIHKKNKEADCETHWITAVRQLRRERAHLHQDTAE